MRRGRLHAHEVRIGDRPRSPRTGGVPQVRRFPPPTIAASSNANRGSAASSPHQYHRRMPLRTAAQTIPMGARYPKLRRPHSIQKERPRVPPPGLDGPRDRGGFGSFAGLGSGGAFASLGGFSTSFVGLRRSGQSSNGALDRPRGIGAAMNGAPLSLPLVSSLAARHGSVPSDG